jgi:intermediate peptidase
MLSRNVRLHLQRVQKVRLSPKRRTLATALNAKSNEFLSFDHPPLHASWSRSPTGLFGQPSLVSPSSFQNLVLATLIRAKLLTERIVRARESRDELFKVVKNLDRLSDMLCSVIDLAELVRNAHPDSEWVKSANEAYEQLCEYMNVLNTNVGLYEVCVWVLLAFTLSVLIRCRVGLICRL